MAEPIRPLSPKAREAFRLSTRRVNIYEGAVRSSKTWTSLFAWLRALHRWPVEAEHVMAGRTIDNVKRNVIAQLQKWMPNYIQYRGSNAGGILHVGDRRVWVVGSANVDAPWRVRGMTAATAYLDELTAKQVGEDFYRAVLERLSLEGSQLFATANSDAPSHWLMKYLPRAKVWIDLDGDVHFYDGNPDCLDLARFSFRLSDGILPASYVEEVSKEFTGMWYRRYVLGEWIAGDGVIYDMWDEQRHLRSLRWEEFTGVPVLALDYGTSHPFVAHLGKVREGRLHVFREFAWESSVQRRQLTDAEYARRLRDFVGDDLPEYVYVPPEAASFYAQLREDGWWGVRDAVNDVADGIRLTATMLARSVDSHGTPALTIDPSAHLLRRQITNYVWDDAEGPEKPVKSDDDSVDSIRYLTASTRGIWR